MSVHLKALRKHLRHQRRSVSRFRHKKSQQDILSRLIRFKPFQQAQKIGLYLHAFGEINTNQIIEYCFKQRKEVYLPMICTMNQQLHWVQISQTQYRNKRFSYHPLGMQEPMASRGLHVSTLDLLIMPLLACDVHGTRIGMGGGFYDKTLASARHKPFRLGIAHDFQLLQLRLPRQPWDQPLDALMTPAKYLHFKR
ncbi:5-formyltetrahydrofolate cyclo-ligase [Acinetobacter bouvetii]|uniref:5-formyltetrahydrofolate cyclo-ligase n=1 Tax=Acinetobacter bouvetii TaxID=202951 RepID=A0A811GD33_9GAMM|nr:5-formyltetrahydrofolate cyclo-ligase [Acinetobacter bouvetii]CAB1214442.1 5-formyltetrahydrofolate cyclo-ligase [Acinetobacter bouvetii]